MSSDWEIFWRVAAKLGKYVSVGVVTVQLWDGPIMFLSQVLCGGDAVNLPEQMYSDIDLVRFLSQH